VHQCGPWPIPWPVEHNRFILIEELGQPCINVAKIYSADFREHFISQMALIQPRGEDDFRDWSAPRDEVCA
jgi:hypothetical protein